MTDEIATATEPWSTGQIIANRYEILEHLGTGGMGVVYRVMDLTNRRVRALKTIRQDLDAESKRLVARLLKAEAEALQRLESDFVVRIFEASLDERSARPFVVMEFLPGRDLQQLLGAQGPLPVSTTVGLLWQAACALKTIHDHGIVHRDLKPANLYLKTRDDGSLELKVLDFSISRLLDRAGERKTTIVVGTRGFMAPEQAAGYDVDHRADIYSLGQVAHALLQSSIEAEAVPERLQAFRGWHAKACAYQREQRFQTAIEAVEALAQALAVSLPHRETVKVESSDGLAAAATLSPFSKRPRRVSGWSLGLLLSAALALAFVFVVRARSAAVGDRSAAATLPLTSAGQAPPPTSATSDARAPVAAATSSVAAVDSATPPAAPSTAPRKPAPPASPRKSPSKKESDGTSDRE